MKRKFLSIITVALITAICLTACELKVEKDKEDDFTGEYVEVTEEEEIRLFDTNGGEDSFLKTILKAIGLIAD